MRDYSKISPQFWIGRTGKALRNAGPEATIVALYLMTCPHANMLGLYYLPLVFVAHETGLGFEGASKGLRRAIEAGFCRYDEASEVVWVVEMARYQIADSLKDKDLRIKGVQNEYDALPENPYLSDFFERYGSAFRMDRRRDEITPDASPFEAPSKPLESQEQEQEQEQKVNATTAHAPEPEEPPTESPPPVPTRKGALAAKLRTLNFEAPPHLPVWDSLLEKFTDEEIVAAAESTNAKKPGERLHLHYLVKVLTKPAKAPPIPAKPPKKSVHDIPGRNAFVGKPAVSDSAGREIPVDLITNADLEKEGIL